MREPFFKKNGWWLSLTWIVISISSFYLYGFNAAMIIAIATLVIITYQLNPKYQFAKRGNKEK